MCTKVTLSTAPIEWALAKSSDKMLQGSSSEATKGDGVYSMHTRPRLGVVCRDGSLLCIMSSPPRRHLPRLLKHLWHAFFMTVQERACCLEAPLSLLFDQKSDYADSLFNRKVVSIM